jgi:hypothetical protein
MLCCRIRILDCYTDPLAWKDKTRKSGNVNVLSNQISLATSSYKSVKDMDKLFLAITELGRGIVFCYVVNCDIFRLRNIFVLHNGFHVLKIIVFFFLLFGDISIHSLAGLVGESKARFCVAIDSVIVIPLI